MSTQLVAPSRAGSSHRNGSAGRPAGRHHGRRIIASIACFALGAVYAFPLFWTASLSVRDRQNSLRPGLLPSSFHPQNYVDAWTSLSLGDLFRNTIFIAVSTVVLSVGMSVLAAYGFSRWRTKLTESIFLIILLGMMVPAAGVIVPFFVIMKELGLYGTLVAVIIAETAFVIPLVVLLMRGFMDRVPGELIDAARVDGASPMRGFIHVVLPLLKPAIATSSLFVLLFAWNDLMLPLVLLPDPTNSTLVVGMALSIGQYGPMSLGMLGAASVLMLLPILVVFIAARRYYVQGLAAGAVKG